MLIDTDNYHRTFPNVPRLSDDTGTVQGVWYCGNFREPSKLYGQYPPGFLDRALSLFPGLEPHEILHCPSGTIEGRGVTVDLKRDQVRRPSVIASADRLPFRSHHFKLILADPPYSRADSRKYGCPPFPIRRAMMEWKRLLMAGGYLGILHTYYPQFRREDWDLRGLIGVVTGFQRAARIFSLFRVKGIRVPFYCNICRRKLTTRVRLWRHRGRDAQVCGRCLELLKQAQRGSAEARERLLAFWDPVTRIPAGREVMLENWRLA